MSDCAIPRGLFADYASGEIEADDLRILEAALREDAELRREFIEYMNVDSALGDLAALTEAEADELDVDPPGELVARISGKAHRRRARAVVLAGAIGAVVLVIATRWHAGPAPEPVAQRVAAVHAVLRPADKGPWNSTTLTAGRYTLERGLLHLRFGGGVMVYLEAPVRFDAVNAGRLVLLDGRLSAIVPPDGVGFTVGTPGAEVVDFGTEFSVEVESGTSEVHVFEGLVRVRPRATKGREAGEAVDLGTAQAVRIVHATEKPVNIESCRGPIHPRFRRAEATISADGETPVTRCLLPDADSRQGARRRTAPLFGRRPDGPGHSPAACVRGVRRRFVAGEGQFDGARRAGRFSAAATRRPVHPRRVRVSR